MDSASASSSTVYLVTGANRGIGLAIVHQLLLNPDNIVFAGVRDPKTAAILKPSERLHILKVVSSDVKGNREATAQIRATTGKLDVVIANAGIMNIATALEATPSDMAEHFNVNTIGPLVLFQATYPLLKESTNPKFTVISSSGGSIEIGASMPMDMISYGTSKAAVNYVTRKIQIEHPEIVAFPIDPGPVDTDMAAHLRKVAPDLEIPFVPPEQSAKAMVKIIENAKHETEGGQFIGHDGQKIAW